MSQENTDERWVPSSQQPNPQVRPAVAANQSTTTDATHGLGATGSLPATDKPEVLLGAAFAAGAVTAILIRILAFRKSK